MIKIIVAIARNNVIGYQNDLPWHYPEDLAYFKDQTINKTVVMGERTFQSIIKRIKKPLPNRKNVVVTHNSDFSYPGVDVVHDLKNYLINQKHEIFIIGGKQIYEFALPYAQELYITHINKDYQGDCFFPEIDYSKFALISKRDAGELSFCIYQRKV